jgi:hypothetical protein
MSPWVLSSIHIQRGSYSTFLKAFFPRYNIKFPTCKIIWSSITKRFLPSLLLGIKEIVSPNLHGQIRRNTTLRRGPPRDGPRLTLQLARGYEIPPAAVTECSQYPLASGRRAFCKFLRSVAKRQLRWVAYCLLVLADQRKLNTLEQL